LPTLATLLSSSPPHPKQERGRNYAPPSQTLGFGVSQERCVFYYRNLM